MFIYRALRENTQIVENTEIVIYINIYIFIYKLKKYIF